MSTAKIIELTDQNICKLCENALARYACPRCKVLYCSLTCYQSEKHSTCSEEFYKECLFQELKDKKDLPQLKASMMQMLKQVHENNPVLHEDYLNDYDVICARQKCSDTKIDEDLDSDDEEFMEIAERLANVDLNDAEQIWCKLTKDEKQEFMAFLQTDDVSNLIPAWTPWWTYSQPLVEDITDEENSYKARCPNIIPIKNFSELTKTDPSPCVQFNLVNILAASLFMARYFNGEYTDFPSEAATCAISVSACLKANANFENYESAVKSVEMECVHSDWIRTDEENMRLLHEDLEKVLKGPNKTEKNFYILCALSELYKLLMDAIIAKNKQNSSNSFLKSFPNTYFPSTKLEDPSKIRSLLKKLEYYMAFANDCFLL